MFPIRLTITGNPPIKKNSRPIWRTKAGRAMLGKSDKLRTAEEAALWELRDQMRSYNSFPLCEKLHVKFIFYRKDHRHTDLSNLYEFAQDVLQQVGIIENDCLIESHDGSRKLIDVANPRTEIYIYPFEK